MRLQVLLLFVSIPCFFVCFGLRNSNARVTNKLYALLSAAESQVLCIC